MLVVTQSGTILGGVVDLLGTGTTIAAMRNDGTMWSWGQFAKNYAGNYGITNIVAIGWPDYRFGPRFLTNDGVYHNGMTALHVNCGPVQ